MFSVYIVITLNYLFTKITYVCSIMNVNVSYLLYTIRSQRRIWIDYDIEWYIVIHRDTRAMFLECCNWNIRVMLMSIVLGHVFSTVFEIRAILLYHDLFSLVICSYNKSTMHIDSTYLFSMRGSDFILHRNVLKFFSDRSQLFCHH